MQNELPVEPRWIDLERLTLLNARIVAVTGEPHGLRDGGLLESAWARPVNRWSYEGEADVVLLAVALMIGIAQNHPFLQGNKRTGFEAGLLFLNINGWRLDRLLDSAAFADAFIALIEHKVDEAAFAERLRPHVVALS